MFSRLQPNVEITSNHNSALIFDSVLRSSWLRESILDWLDVSAHCQDGSFLYEVH